MDHDHLKSYIDDAFTHDRISAELSDHRSTFFLAEINDEPVGYAKLRVGDVPDCVGAANAVELERIYAVRSYIGRGIGRLLMETVLKKAQADNHDGIWLGVWENNVLAIRFYEKWGFKPVGEQTFTVGTDVQRDIVFERSV